MVEKQQRISEIHPCNAGNIKLYRAHNLQDNKQLPGSAAAKYTQMKMRTIIERVNDLSILTRRYS